ncbi:MAG: helix-turn-helix transcriptional regulator, partial [Clostridia bacterium]|nr:helix-turn-helix transcriptional regulator [Clostridia bacterium]
MDLSSKITKLRKSLALSQEELAEKLGVSRQAVSKWESGQSLPDIDKIILMSSFFGVSTDYLLKDEVKDEPETQHGVSDTDFEAGESPRISSDEIKTIIHEKYREAKIIAIAVLLFILSPLTLICLLSLADSEIINASIALAIGLFVLFSLVTLGVGLCIYSSFLISPYKNKLKTLPGSTEASVFYEIETERTQKRKRLSYILGTSLTIISPLPIIFYAIFSGFENANPEKPYLYFPLCMAFL